MRKIIKIRGLFKNIRDLYICYDTIENMPLFLRFITRVSLNGFICFPIFFLLFLILPLAMGGIHVNGEYFTWQEFWKRGEPLVVFAWASWMLLIPYGVLRKRKWVRPLLVCFLLIQILSVGIVGFLFNHPKTLNLFNNFNSTKDLLWYVFHLSVWGTMAAWYLYYKKTVVEFFNLEESRIR